MNVPDNTIITHYSKNKLYDVIIEAIKNSGINLNKLKVEDFKSVDEFHIGGLQATLNLLDQLKIKPETKILDIGAGIGGPARLISSHYKANVTGIDLTPDFVETAIKINDLLGLNIKFQIGDALNIPFNENEYNLATLLHVGMNISDKNRLFSEVSRVLNKGGIFAIYDVMIIAEGDLEFPVPWASIPNASFVEGPNNYHDAAIASGFTLISKRSREKFALEFFNNLKKIVEKSGPPAVGLNLVMGSDSKIKIENVVNAIEKGHLAPVEMIFVKNNIHTK